MTKALFTLWLAATSLFALGPPSYGADTLPIRTNEFVSVCSSRGLFAKIFANADGTRGNCAVWLGFQAGLASVMGKGPGCATLKYLAGDTDDLDNVAAHLAQPIFNWLSANRANSTDEIDKDTADAILALYDCKG
jgi:hypothetical protein